MKTDELFVMLDRFTADTGKTPNKIICGETAFEKLRMEAINELGTRRYLEANFENGCVAKFAGIPVQVVRNNDVLEDDKFYVLNEPDDYDAFKPIRMTQWWARAPYGQNRLLVDDLIDAQVMYDPKNMEYKIRHDDGFMTHYYGEWLYNNTVSPNARYAAPVATPEEEVDISDADLMAVLNGGGFNAVA